MREKELTSAGSSISRSLGACFLFSELAPSKREFLARMGQRVHYPKNSIILHEGDPSPGLFVLERGRAKIFKVSPGGKELILHFVGPGQTFAEAAVIGNFPLPASVQTMEDSDLILLRGDLLNQALSEDPDLSRGMLISQAKTIHRFVDQLDRLVFSDALERVTHFFFDLYSHQRERNIDSQKGGGEEVWVRLPGTKRDLAAHLNLTSETLSRVLRELKDQNVIAEAGDLEGTDLEMGWEDREGRRDLVSGRPREPLGANWFRILR